MCFLTNAVISSTLLYAEQFFEMPDQEEIDEKIDDAAYCLREQQY